MFNEPRPTPYDLRWTMFGTHVRVHPFFWLMCVIFGSGGGLDLRRLAVWTACVFVSILVHEFGHIWMGQYFGSRGHIVLHGFGGLAIGSNALANRWQRIAVSLAGPGAGFAFLAIILGVLYVVNPGAFPVYVNLMILRFHLPLEWIDFPHGGAIPIPIILEIVDGLIFINLLWGILNLLPIWPLDGGQISRNLCEAFSEERGSTTALGISMLIAAALAMYCFLAAARRESLPMPFDPLYTGIMFALLAVQSYLAMQQEYQRRRFNAQHWDDR